MTKIVRRPIILDHHTVAVIHIFTRLDKIKDLWMDDNEQYNEEMYNQIIKESAKQFIEEFEDNWCEAFMESLRDEIDALLIKIKKERKEF